jgi:hypothetical protein
MNGLWFLDIMDAVSARFVKNDLAARIDNLLGIGKYHDPFSFRHAVHLRNSEAGVQMALLNMDLHNEEYDEWRHFAMGCRKEKFMQVYVAEKLRIRTPGEFVSYWNALAVDSKDIPYLGSKAEEDMACYIRYRKNYVPCIDTPANVVVLQPRVPAWKNVSVSKGF